MGQLEGIARRLALSYAINELYFWCDPDEKRLNENIRRIKLPENGSIAVTVKNRSRLYDSRSLIQIIASQITNNRSVDLENPDIAIRLVICDDRWFVGRKLCDISRSTFENRRVHHRPFFSPISLHPKLARALVNLSHVKKGDSLLDPFCGTGGFLIEAGLIGLKGFGNDVEAKMIDGCRESLQHFGIDGFKLMVGDVEDLVGLISDIDAIVTDMPYGKSTTTLGESLEALYHRAFQVFISVLKEGGIVVAGGSLEAFENIADEYISVDSVFKIRVHRSLTRYFVCGHR
jgi:tRNA (guanine10-N2)-dimethyltransferase